MQTPGVEQAGTDISIHHFLIFFNAIVILVEKEGDRRMRRAASFLTDSCSSGVGAGGTGCGKSKAKLCARVGLR